LYFVINIIQPFTPSPENIPWTIRIDAEQLIELVIDKSEVQLIDSRIRTDRHYGFIEGFDEWKSKGYPIVVE
jgi:hypothetical protein